ncbi:MAG TPA: hypothetical protein VF173_35565 [Thermoanaerobaculia bacterium]|nr:hypothetical protein [Thermoanaerobaculia bacterium]
MSADRPRPATAPPLLLAVLLALVGSPSHATSFVPMTDEALADQAPAAAVVRVLAIDPGAGARDGGAWATEYRVQVETRLKGDLPGATLRVRVLGGTGPRGLALRIDGAPRFAVGERLLLLLEPATDGAFRGIFRPSQLFLGAFHEVRAGDRSFAVRELSQASELRLSADGAVKAQPEGPDRLRDFGAFARWIAARAAGTPRPADYLVDDADGSLRRSLAQSLEKFTLFTDPDDHLNLRWFDFDQGGHVDWKAFSTGEKGVPGGGYEQFQAGLAAWTAEPQTPIDCRYAGTTDSTSALEETDGVNAIVFNDPRNLVPDFSCSAGGVLAIGGPFYATAPLTFQGEPFHPIVEADVVVNNGLECFFAHSPNAAKAAEEIFGHELGHTLGLGHSCGDSRSPACAGHPDFDTALMRAFVHDDGRGARLAADDRAAIRALYGNEDVPPGPCVPSATALCIRDRFQASVTWRAPDGSEGAGQVMPVSSADSGLFWFTSPDNLELLVKVLDGCSLNHHFWVYTGPATDLQFTLTVIDTRTGKVRVYANPQGMAAGSTTDSEAFATCL